MKYDSFAERQSASAAAKRAMLDRFRGALNDPKLSEKQAERAAIAAARAQRQAERRAAREAERKRQAEEAARRAAEEAARKAAEEAARKAEEERIAAEKVAEEARRLEELRRDAELTAMAEAILRAHQKSKRNAGRKRQQALR